MVTRSVRSSPGDTTSSIVSGMVSAAGASKYERSRHTHDSGRLTAAPKARARDANDGARTWKILMRCGAAPGRSVALSCVVRTRPVGASAAATARGALMPPARWKLSLWSSRSGTRMTWKGSSSSAGASLPGPDVRSSSASGFALPTRSRPGLACCVESTTADASSPSSRHAYSPMSSMMTPAWALAPIRALRKNRTIDARMLAKVSHAEYDMPRSVTEPSSGPRSCTRL
mmetsp:Transcript_31573/g.94123  ORF Transcript_31573/g.94123 Transcript_31573/m.94123 type:complete len:230 (-) Transcript_31573:3292-3981(-)